MSTGHPMFWRHRSPGSFRKTAVAIWRAPNDPTLAGTTSVEVTKALHYLRERSSAAGARLTVTHLVVRAVALAMRRFPESNTKVHWGRILVRDRVDVFVQVDIDGGSDLSGTLVEDADRKTIEGIAKAVESGAAKLRAGTDPMYGFVLSLVRRLPSFLVRPLYGFASLVVNVLHRDLPVTGLRRDPFGCAMVSNVGMFGLDVGYGAFVPIARCGVFVVVGEVKTRPWVVGDQVEPRPVLNLSGIFDHRLFDGYHAGRLAREVRRYLEEPALLDVETAPARAAAPRCSRSERFEHDGGRVGVLVLHGFTGSPVSVVPWARYLADAGLTVSVPCLPGHGTTWQEMNRTTWHQWYAEAERCFETLRRKCDALFVMGLSMGGALSLRLAEEKGRALCGLVLVNPAVHTEDPGRFVLPLLRFVQASRPGIANDIRKLGVDEGAYDRMPLHAAYSLTRLWSAVRRDITKVDQPLLVFRSTLDRVVEPSNARWILRRVSSDHKTERLLHASGHVATLDHDAETICSESLEFVRRFSCGLTITSAA
jgi:carboxylesterase